LIVSDFLSILAEHAKALKKYLDNLSKVKAYSDLLSQILIYGGLLLSIKHSKNAPTENFDLRAELNLFPKKVLISELIPLIPDSVFSKAQQLIESLKTLNQKNGIESLITTLYSDFLRYYDPEIAKNRGIKFTPKPVVRFMIQSIDYFLKTKFSEQKGLFTENLILVDPAAGTNAFLCEILKYSKKIFKQNKKEFLNWVHNIFLKKYYAYEILDVPYLLSYIRYSLIFDKLGISVNGSNEGLNIYQLNSLTSKVEIENSEASLIILGNPPYNISSQNKIRWIEKKIEKYKNNLQREGRKAISSLKALQDDYIKFFAFAQDKIKEKGQGIIGFITNNYYIDGLQFRGLRASFRKDFDEIWIIDLHGDARKQIPIEIEEKGIKFDENIFDIKVGVAIIFLIRIKEHRDNDCRVKYFSIWGTSERKFELLTNNTIQNLAFESVSKRLDYEFCPDQFKLRKRYNTFPCLSNIFNQNIVGIQTGHDGFVSDVDKERLEKKILTFLNKGELSKFGSHVHARKNRDWDPEKARRDTNFFTAKSKILLWNYRGFDKRYICYDLPLINGGTDRYRLMQYLLPPNDNIALITDRTSRASDGSSSVLVVNTISETVCCEGPRGIGSYIFPLKINDSDTPDDFFTPKLAIHSNIREQFKKKLVNIGLFPSHSRTSLCEDKRIFYYIYAVLYTPIYRRRYRKGLGEDFPRIPFPSEFQLFSEMALLGEKLVNLHLLKIPTSELDAFPINKGRDFKILHIKRQDRDEKNKQITDTYDPRTNKIYFNKRTKQQEADELNGDNIRDISWIGNIFQEMWDFEIGGRQQLKEWLYARRYSSNNKKNSIPRELNSDEITYFLKMCAAIKRTIQLQARLNTLYKKIDSF